MRKLIIGWEEINYGSVRGLGGMGYIGSHTTVELLNAGYNVIGLR